MRISHLLATSSGILALLLGVSCDSGTDGGSGGAAGTSGAAGRQNGAAGNESGGTSSGGSSNGGTSSGGSSNGGTSSGGTSSGGTSSGGTSSGGASNASGGAAGAANGGQSSGAAGEGGVGGVAVGGAAGASEGDAGVTSAGDGEPCPNGDCAAGLVCVGYGNPLPNGESSACRRQCSADDPPPRCTCAGGGYCEESVGDPDAGSGTIGCEDTDAGCTCGEVIVNPGCADADDTTTDFQGGEFLGCVHWRDLGEGQGWIHYDTSGGFHYDLSTSLGWVLRSTSGAMTLAQAADFCASFSIVGLSEWRLPTINEARSLAGGCANTAPGGSCPISDSSCLNASCGVGEGCESCSGSVGNYYCRADAMICNSFHTSSLCPDCATPGRDWYYGTINGNFVAAPLDQLFFPVCVMEDIPRAVPCRN